MITHSEPSLFKKLIFAAHACFKGKHEAYGLN